MFDNVSERTLTWKEGFDSCVDREILQRAKNSGLSLLKDGKEEKMEEEEGCMEKKREREGERRP